MSVASSLQSEPRATNDIDIVLALASTRVPDLAEEFGSDAIDQEHLNRWAPSLNLIKVLERARAESTR